jgi:superfamily II DNA helicase RecQ
VTHDVLLADALDRVWGFSDFRPLQREAMHAILDGRDSVVVLPTGGGKSLCFQAPAIVDAQSPAEAGRHDESGPAEAGSRIARRRGLALVVSPLISLL